MVPSLCVCRAGVWKQEIKAIGLPGPLPLKTRASLSFINYFAAVSKICLLSKSSGQDQGNSRQALLWLGLSMWQALVDGPVFGLSWSVLFCLGSVSGLSCHGIAPRSPLHGLKMARDQAKMPRDGPSMVQDLPRTGLNMSLGSYLGTLLGHIRARLGNRRTLLIHCGGCLGSSWGSLGFACGLCWAIFGTIVVPCGACLDSSWNYRGPSWGYVGPSWSSVGLP